ncbi:DEAD/DEAH box helicase family protein [Solicola gregarius]|uniref:DEAD/DEAH box helicase family protein n=1 Tax=Solicola gregarius TaxID=2908642 RepID=A0AA46TGC1_9ACTN|nr:DEAD/DEAH box helicase family protein [Solicola gregarius]UYM04596.1 DEAD/DEAH box helicase family protein [Solicola gregarius]
MTGGPLFTGIRRPFEPRTHQRAALGAVASAVESGARRSWVVLPPGSGKTYVGLEVIRQRGVPAVVLAPNTAIQMQWHASWRAYGSDIEIGTERDLAAPITALTYQSLASFDGERDGLDDNGAEPSLVDRLHPNGRALVDALRSAGPITIVLDECHHLLEVWGRLLAEVLDRLPGAFVLGLTATPPTVLDKQQHALVDELFGSITYAASIPAAVREGTLAPFAELARVTTPTPAESQWLAGQSERFTRLTTDLMEPGFGSVGLLHWLDRRFVESGEPWHDIERRWPALVGAALRLSYAGLLSEVHGARLREEHRHPPSADDWVVLIDDWARGCLLQSGDAGDADLVERIRRTLPGIGYQWTRRGIRRGRSPVDRVLARSAAKADECVEIVAAERAVLGEHLRLLVVCDHEKASATAPESLHGVLDPEAGSARLLLSRLVSDDRTRELNPLLVTGSTVAAEPATAHRLVAFVGERDPELADALRIEAWAGAPVAGIVGSWSSRAWVRLVTAFFEAGHAQVLVGTRALLGEGWDARGLNSLVDLSSATTVSAVVQTRGRALRTDPDWADKVALTWSVVCVTEDHPRGATDWDRFVRKHDGYFGVDDEGDIVSGVSHVDSRLSPYAPPGVADLPALNASMLVRAESRAEIAERWAVGAPYADEVVHTIRVRDRRTTAVTEGSTVGAPPAPALLTGARGPYRVSDGRRPWLHPWRSARVAGRAVGTTAYAAAVADGLLSAELCPAGSEALRIDVEPDGEIRLRLHGVGEEASRLFAESLDEVLAPLAEPRYVVPRYVLGDATRVDGWRQLVRALRPEGVAWHAVPRVLGVNASRARAYERGWNAWVSGGQALYTGSPTGAGILAANTGIDPFEADTVLRPAWT